MSTNRKAHRINFSLLIKRQYVKVLIIGCLSFLVSGPLLYFTASENYSAEVQLRIDPVSTSNVPGSDAASIGGYYSSYVATQKFKILKPANIEKALHMLDQNQLIGVLGGPGPINEKAIAGITKAITVEPARESLILSVSIIGESPIGLAEFLNDLVKVYMDDLQTEQDTKDTNRINFTDKQKSDLEAKIQELTGQVKGISDEISTGNFASDDIPFKIELKIQEDAAIRAENDRLLKEKKYNEFIKNMYKPATAGVEVAIETRLSTDTLLMEQKRVLLAKIDSLTTQLQSLSAQNTGRKELEDSIAKNTSQIAELESKAREKYRKLIESENTSNLEKQKSLLYSEYIVAKEYEDAVKKSYREVQEKYSFVSKKAQVGKGLEDDLANLKTQLSEVNKTHTILVGQQGSSGLVTVENYAKPPIAPDKSTVTKRIIMAFVASFGWIIALVVLMEFLDQRVKSSAELKSYTGIKPSWPISHYNSSILNVSIQDRDSVVYRAVQSLATRINQERQNFQAKVVAFTGIQPSTGATELLLNCAHAMTDSCERILVIDFNTSRPSIAAKLNIPARVQPTVKSLENASLESVIYSDIQRGIDVLTLRNPDKLENKIVDRVLELAKDRYDIVFIDVAPILSNSSTEHLFLQSNTAVFVVRGNKTTFPDLHHTLELADKFGIVSAALVLNWWKFDPKAEKAVEVVE